MVARRILLVSLLVVITVQLKIVGGFTTIQSCVDDLENPGDECRIPPGIYREDVVISGKHGTAEKPIIITGSAEDRPVIDGTVDINPDKWTRYTGADKMVDGVVNIKPIYKAKISQDIWQLFVDGKMMTNARWPNALWSDKTVFSGKHWALVSEDTKPGVMVDNGVKDLAGSGLDATGAVAILNIGSFNTYSAIVTSHVPGSDRFTYDNVFNNRHFKAKKSKYFLEDKLDFLDQPGEWFYNKNTKMLYIWADDGESLSKHKVTGKVRTYSFTITDCTHVIFQNLVFHATTLQARSKYARVNYVSDLEFKSISFNYPSYSKRMIGETDPPEWTRVLGVYHSHRFTFFNNTFYGSDGVALEFRGVNVRLENNLFEYNDWTGANMKTFAGGMGTIVSKGSGAQFVRNTMRYNGASAGYRPGGSDPLVKLNHFHHQCWGNIQNDGSHVQLQVKTQTNAILQQNWVHDSPKYGLRFDGEPPKVGRHGTMKMNVVWKCNGIMVKGDDHQVYNNLAFGKIRDVDGDGQGAGCMLCVLKYVRKNPVPINNETIIMYNAADVADGGVHYKQRFPLAGKVIEHNVVGSLNDKYNIKSELMDADNLDFRPRENSELKEVGAGAYSYDKTATKYWIPGRQEYKACTPVPPDGSITTKTNRDALMWLNGYGASTHHVFLGMDETSVQTATLNSPEFKGTITDDGNIYYLQENLNSRTTYFWRVDAQIDETTVYRGDVWSFKTTG